MLFTTISTDLLVATNLLTAKLHFISRSRCRKLWKSWSRM